MSKKNEIRIGEHWLICGSTGCGKTVLANSYLSNTNQRVFVLDTKGTFNWLKDFNKKESMFIRNLKDLKKLNKKIHKIIYRPVEKELTNDYFDTFLKFVYKLGDSIVYIDEVAQICKNAHSYPLYLKHLLQRGRELGLSVISSSQRPRDIFKGCFTESTHYYIFRLNSEDDRKSVAKDCSNDTFKNKLEGFYFYYWRGDKEFTPIKSIIKMKGKVKKDE